jgi:hypothetical protein
MNEEKIVKTLVLIISQLEFIALLFFKEHSVIKFMTILNVLSLNDARHNNILFNHKELVLEHH